MPDQPTKPGLREADFLDYRFYRKINGRQITELIKPPNHYFEKPVYKTSHRSGRIILIYLCQKGFCLQHFIFTTFGLFFSRVVHAIITNHHTKSKGMILVYSQDINVIIVTMLY